MDYIGLIKFKQPVQSHKLALVIKDYSFPWGPPGIYRHLHFPPWNYGILKRPADSHSPLPHPWWALLWAGTSHLRDRRLSNRCPEAPPCSLSPSQGVSQTLMKAQTLCLQNLNTCKTIMMWDSRSCHMTCWWEDHSLWEVIHRRTLGGCKAQVAYPCPVCLTSGRFQDRRAAS